MNSNDSYLNNGSRLWRTGASTIAFSAPAILDGNTATVHSVHLQDTDDGPDAICADMYRTHQKSGNTKVMSAMCTKGAAIQTRTKIDTTTKAATVGTDNATYVWVEIPAATYGLRGVTIVYTSDP